jgi:hypothetical protein
MMSYSPSVGALAILRLPLFSPMRTWGNTATSVRVWGGARVRRPRLRRLALLLRPWTPLTINIYCVTAVVLSPQRAEIMPLPEFTAVGRLGFARWNKGQHGSDSGAAQRPSPGVLRPPPKLEMGAQPERQNHTSRTGPATLTVAETAGPADHQHAQ